MKNLIYLEVKCEVIETILQDARDGRYETVSVLRSCMSFDRSFSGNVAGWGLGALPIDSINVEI